MIKRLRKITKDVWRGSAPSPQDVQILKNNFGINKIVSLDEISGEKISRTCKLLGIKQIKIYLDGSRSSLFNLLHHNLKKLLLNDGPTYIHCHEGKDRTGLLAALFECKYMNKDPEDAIEEAKSLGFGVGVDPQIVNLYEKIIRSCKPSKDNNNADIVSNEREYISDNRSGVLNEAHQGSFAPYLSPTRQDPYDNVYNDINDQSPTRENYDDYKSIKEHKDVVPLVGVSNTGIQGAGPTLNAGGFIYD
ncbi:Protein-tyrosine phosphatase, SIW14-like [uncultured Caudovirales phage]|uniref:Protein-tyrosine phosphatase, SIW14-like n=1 Tax=uncultured Caudovirales phage TaxID=2100421 RepID=A0A6J5RU40_9CAUD|nr:Protein-tyrosine phosphatase, SIW14-like [uncultured Caudovirales phage]